MDAPSIASVRLLVRRPGGMIDDAASSVTQIPFAFDGDLPSAPEAKLKLETANANLGTFVAYERLKREVRGNAIHTWLVA